MPAWLTDRQTDRQFFTRYLLTVEPAELKMHRRWTYGHWHIQTYTNKGVPWLTECRYITCVGCKFDVCELLCAEGADSHETASGLWMSPVSCIARTYNVCDTQQRISPEAIICRLLHTGSLLSFTCQNLHKCNNICHRFCYCRPIKSGAFGTKTREFKVHLILSCWHLRVSRTQDHSYFLALVTRFNTNINAYVEIFHCTVWFHCCTCTAIWSHHSTVVDYYYYYYYY